MRSLRMQQHAPPTPARAKLVLLSSLPVYNESAASRLTTSRSRSLSSAAVSGPNQSQYVCCTANSHECMHVQAYEGGQLLCSSTVQTAHPCLCGKHSSQWKIQPGSIKACAACRVARVELGTSGAPRLAKPPPPGLSLIHISEPTRPY